MKDPATYTLEDTPAAAAQIFSEHLAAAQRYAQLLATDGVVRGLIGPREAPILWTRHILNSAVVAEAIPADTRVVDIGSGAGLPGIPLALARPDLRIDLVEPLLRRTTFLEEVVAELGLTRVRVVRGRADEVIEMVGGADVVTARAVAPLGKLAVWASPLLRIGGQLAVLKGRSAGDEIAQDAEQLTAAGFKDVAVRTVGDGLPEASTTVVVGVKEREMDSGAIRTGQRQRKKPTQNTRDRREGHARTNQQARNRQGRVRQARKNGKSTS